MTYSFPSEAWTLAFKDAVNSNEGYRKAGEPWTFGSVAMVVRANEGLGIEQDIAMLLDVHAGECRKSEHYVDASAAADLANFVIVAEYARWKEVLTGQLEPIKGMMQGRLKLTKGHLPTMVRFVEASRQLVESANRVPTEFIA